MYEINLDKNLILMVYIFPHLSLFEILFFLLIQFLNMKISKPIVALYVSSEIFILHFDAILDFPTPLTLTIIIILKLRFY